MVPQFEVPSHRSVLPGAQFPPSPAHLIREESMRQVTLVASAALLIVLMAVGSLIAKSGRLRVTTQHATTATR